MRLPFPLELSVGTDLISCTRILDPLRPDPTRLLRLTNRFLHADELHDLDHRFPTWRAIDTEPEATRRRIGFWLAGRWAAKEAAKKAWGASLLGWKDLRVDIAQPAGKVHMICCPVTTAHKHGQSIILEQVAQLSISHDADFATATVLATPLHHDILAKLQERKGTAAANGNEQGEEGDAAELTDPP